jgi:hypothetical protein
MLEVFKPIAKRMRKTASEDYLKCQNHIIQIMKKKRQAYGDEFDFAKLAIKHPNIIGAAFLGLINEKTIRKTGKFRNSGITRQHGHVSWQYELIS